MVYLKKTLFFMSLLFLQIQGVFAGIITDNLGTTLSSFSEKIIKDANVMYFLFFVAIFFGTFTIFKLLIGTIFKSNKGFGDSGHHKASNVVAFMFSFIGTSGLFFLFKDKGAEYVVTLLGGSFGILIVLMWSAVVMWGFMKFAHIFPKEKKILRLFIYFLGLTISIGSLDLYLVSLISSLYGAPNWMKIFEDWTSSFWEIVVLGLIITGIILIFGIFKFNSREKSPEQKNRNKVKQTLQKLMKESKNSANIYNELGKNLQEIRNSVKLIDNDETKRGSSQATIENNN